MIALEKKTQNSSEKSYVRHVEIDNAQKSMGKTIIAFLAN